MTVMPVISTSSTRRGGSRRVLGLLQVVLALLFASIMASAIAGEGGRTPKPVVVVESDEACVAPPAQMRREHAQILARQKDRTVREGIRGERGSLAGCINCHASSENRSVVGSDRNFCQSCHSFVAVKLNCFDCHQPAPGKGEHGVSTASTAHGPIAPLTAGEGAR